MIIVYNKEVELRALLCGLVMIRRLKIDVVQHLPNKFREVRYVIADPFYLQQLRDKQEENKQLEKAIRSLDLNIIDNAGVAMRLRSEQQQNLNQQFSITGMCKVLLFILPNDEISINLLYE